MSSMSHLGHLRQFGRRPTTSGLPLETDIVRAGRHVSKMPQAEIDKAGQLAAYCCAAGADVASNIGNLQLPILKMQVVLIELSGCPQPLYVEHCYPSAAQIDQTRLLHFASEALTCVRPSPTASARSVPQVHCTIVGLCEISADPWIIHKPNKDHTKSRHTNGLVFRVLVKPAAPMHPAIAPPPAGMTRQDKPTFK